MSFLFEEEEIVEEVPTFLEKIPTRKPIEEKAVVLKEEAPETDKPKSIFVDLNETSHPLESSKHDKPLERFQQQKEASQPYSKRRTSEPMEYEFSSNISPIYGRREQNDKPVITVQPKIELETSESVLGTIISPIYGVKKGNRPVKKQEKLAPVSPTMSLEDVLGIHDDVQPKVTQLSLDQEELNHQEKEDILMQLFEEDAE